MRYKRGTGERRILDRAALAEVLESLEPPGHGQQSAIATKLDVGRNTVSRLIRRVQRNVSGDLYRKLLEHVPNARERLRWCFGTAATEAAIREYGRWLRQHGAWACVDCESGALVTGSEGLLAAQVYPRDDQESRVMIARIESVCRRSEARKEVQSFKRWLEAKGWGPVEKELRLAVAKHQVIVPLLQSGPTWGVERAPAELVANGQLGNYLRLAFKAQKVLLDRAPMIERVRDKVPPASARGVARASVIVTGVRSGPTHTQ